MNKKGYDVKVFREDKYVLFKIYKNITMKMVMSMAVEHVALVEQGILSNLTDVRGVRCDMSTSEIYDHGYENTERLQIPHDIKLAVLKDEDDDSHNFMETVGRNAGYQVSLFHAEADALDWIRKV